MFHKKYLHRTVMRRLQRKIYVLLEIIFIEKPNTEKQYKRDIQKNDYIRIIKVIKAEVKFLKRKIVQ